ncbi:co-chaperone DjlA [Pokkaliibacter sp. CJK22405]|uniref:co-chaperone DjlA n=1 Tax=Pokkaliibacter sp. CJK22405 TaxID=3384615 RepID=UPI003984B554
MSNGLLDSLRRHRTGIIAGAIICLPWGLKGVIIGALIGFWLDRRVRSALGGSSQLEVQRSFFVATFTVMGRLAKADGRVSESEIAFARVVMDRMRLNEDQRREAINHFNRGKDPDFSLSEALQPLAFAMSRSFALRQIFLEIQLQAAMVDGQITQAEVEVLDQVCRELRISVEEFQALIRRMQAEQAFYQWHQQGSGSSSQEHSRSQSSWGSASKASGLQEAYGVLGVDASTSDQEVKKAYRRLMSQHHPDKLVSKGLPDEMIQLAKEKTQEIQAAYERVKAARGMR